MGALMMQFAFLCAGELGSCRSLPNLGVFCFSTCKGTGQNSIQVKLYQILLNSKASLCCSSKMWKQSRGETSITLPLSAAGHSKTKKHTHTQMQSHTHTHTERKPFRIRTPVQPGRTARKLLHSAWQLLLTLPARTPHLDSIGVEFDWAVGKRKHTKEKSNRAESCSFGVTPSQS